MSSTTVSTTDFARFNLGPNVERGIAAAGFVHPRPIQEQTIPAALEGRDVLGLAQTGTGKTAAFVLPILARLLSVRRDGPRVLIVAPTRELATQIGEDIRSLARFTPIRVTLVFGGVSMGAQISALRSNPEIVVGCPGRILDLYQQRALRLDRIETLVLDEADHMFDMGFLPDIRRIVQALPRERQNIMYAATMPREIRVLADQMLRRPHVVELTHSRPASTIDHAVYPVGGDDKLPLLRSVLADETFVSAIVFTRTKHRARRLARQLADSGHRAVALQGNMSQNQRDRAMAGFRRREFDVLVATDIAARGLDVEQVSHVVNFDMPGTPEAYTHRIGRTGRAERSGKAYTFVTSEDAALVREVERRIGAPIPRRNLAIVPAFAGRASTRPAHGASRPIQAGPRPTHAAHRPMPPRSPHAAAGPRHGAVAYGAAAAVAAPAAGHGDQRPARTGTRGAMWRPSQRRRFR
jgi:ATP-dependent RNA helicase RhlE